MSQESRRKTRKTRDIALVHWAYPPTVGGVESYLWNCSRLLARAGHRVTVFTGTREARKPPEGGVEVLWHPGLDLSRVTGEEAERDALREWFGDELERRRIHLVHGHNLHHFSPAPAEALLALRDRLGLVLLHTYHSIWSEPESVAIAESCRRFDAHFAVSEFLRGACADVLRLTDVQPMYLGIDTESFLAVPELADPQPKEEAIVLLPARLIPDKGAKTAIEAMAKVISEDPPVRPRLILMNTPNSVDFHGEKVGFRGDMNLLAKNQHMDDCVDFLQAGVDAMPDFYRRARVVICPSRFAEPMGLAALEAMCSARPVIASDVGGLAEGVGRDGSAGFLVPADDSDALAAQIVRLLSDPALARSVGNAARKRVVAEFDLAGHCLPLTLKAYERCLRTAFLRVLRARLTRRLTRWNSAIRQAVTRR
ncbi:glycosyltransferase family 4 protein [Streptomyces sp. S.PB5]|uniref:glycosyltransferase family 4 protein n=1 Tax=Streptomyces sp. S.PB5 TaxID=3020844 RepID=UPI0025AF12E2|nr:glycosyltransferase family 4 protein [Streptomyces sp. S.PB5]MDN3021062.1 glycosyltransferase family 4 protein [Streptomyces sp. S.PB5]